MDRVISSLSSWKSHWEQEKEIIHTHSCCCPGHAVLTAASVLYLPRVPADSHRSLWDSWLGYCAGRGTVGSLDTSSAQQQHHPSSHQTRVQIEPDFAPTTVLSLEEERARWNHYASFPDSVTLDCCIAARKSLETPFTPPPLVLDPHQLFQGYAHELELERSLKHLATSESLPQQLRQPASCVEVMRVSTKGWSQTLCDFEETKEKAVVLILDKKPSTTDKNVLISLLRRRSEDLKGSWDTTLPSQEPFRYREALLHLTIH